MCTPMTAASGPAATTNTATMVLAQQSNTLPEPVIPLPHLKDEEANTHSKSSSRRSRKDSKKSKQEGGSKRAKRIMKKSPSTVSPNSDEIRKESLAIEREHSSGGGGSVSCARPTCAMCGSSLSKSISQASNFSNVIVERPSDSGSVQTTASAQAALQGTSVLENYFWYFKGERKVVTQTILSRQ